MNSFEINKIVAAIILAIIIVFGINIISDIIFNTTDKNVVAYKVEAPEGSNNNNSTENDLDIATFLAMGDISHGKTVFKKCKACHTIKKDGKNKIGPNLYSIVARATGTVPGYKYSSALVSYNKSWSFAELNGFLIKPSSWIKGNKMGFAGLKNEKDRASVILYLNANGDNPLPLP